MNITEAFEKLEELLSDPDRWTQLDSAQDQAGKAVEIDSPKAVKFCVLGGAERVSWENYERMFQLLTAQVRAHPEEFNHALWVTDVNDQLGHGSVMKLIRFAREKA